MSIKKLFLSSFLLLGTLCHTLSGKECYLFTSFSLSEPSWLALSQELQLTGGTFVIRGLPQDSFHTLVERVNHLKKAGMEASICIDPILFEKYAIDVIPTFVIAHGDHFFGISGNIPIRCALERALEKEEIAPYAKEFLSQLNKGAFP